MIAHGIHDGVHAVIFPVQAIHIPLNTVITQRGSGLDDLVGVIAVGRPEQCHLITGQIFDLVMDFHQLRLHLFRAELAHIFVVFAVIADIVSGSEDHFYIVRIGFHPSARGKKGDFDIMLFQNGQDLFGVLVTPRSVKSQSDLGLVGLHAVDRKISSVYGGGDTDDTGQVEKCSGKQNADAQHQCCQLEFYGMYIRRVFR